MTGLPLEIERKFLIRMPDAALLAAQPGTRIKHITQTSLLSPAGVTARVRRQKEDGQVRYTRTEKRRLSDMTAIEEECELDEDGYRAALGRLASSVGDKPTNAEFLAQTAECLRLGA